jgi:hypothetical protein
LLFGLTRIKILTERPGYGVWQALILKATKGAFRWQSEAQQLLVNAALKAGFGKSWGPRRRRPQSQRTMLCPRMAAKQSLGSLFSWHKTLFETGLSGLKHSSATKFGVSQMPWVSSSAIDRIEWENGTLSIWFRASGRYDYFGVPNSVYLNFLNAPSKGGFYNDHIKDRY